MTFSEVRRKIGAIFFKGRNGESAGYEGKLLNHETTSFGVMEAYRMARTGILYTGLGEKSTVIGVTSASPNEGKSLTCANLAISFGMSGKKVLIVDADMRNPTQFRIFHENGAKKKKEGKGLSEFLAGIIQTPEVMETGCENVHLMCAGKCPPDSAGLLGREAFGLLVAKLKEEYDFIFFDLPPVGIIADAAVVAKHMDGYVLVVQSAFSDTHLIRDAVDTLQSVGGSIVGFILNAVEPKGGFYGRGRRHAYDYGRYDTTEEKAKTEKRQTARPKKEKTATDKSGKTAGSGKEETK